MATPNAANQNADNQYCYKKDTGKGQKRKSSHLSEVRELYVGIA